MGLSDIEKKIIGDAEQEAAQIVIAAKEAQEKRLAEVKKAIVAERKRAQEQSKLYVVQTVAQKKQLYELTAAQNILQKKRELLNTLFQEVQEKISADPKQLSAYYIKVLNQIFADLQEPVLAIEVAEKDKETLIKVLAQMKKDITIKSTSAVSGTLEIIFKASRINCSLDLYIRENSKSWEKELVQVLFEGK